MLDLFKNLRLHAEGGDGAAAGPAPGAEASGVTAPGAGEQQQRPSWEEVKKQYKDEYGKDVQTAIQGRFKNQKDNAQELETTKATLSDREDMIAQMAAALNIGPGADGKPDYEAIKQAMGRNRVEEYAMEHGVSDEYAAKAIAMEDELAAKDRQLRELQLAEEARKQSEESYRLVQEHRRQAEALRQDYPELLGDFDLEKEVEENGLFAHLIVNCGVGVENAYFAAHHRELMKAGKQAAAIQAQRALATSIQAGASMPTEVGLGRTPAASPQRVNSPRNWTEEQWKEAEKLARQGRLRL